MELSWRGKWIGILVIWGELWIKYQLIETPWIIHCKNSDSIVLSGNSWKVKLKLELLHSTLECKEIGMLRGLQINMSQRIRIQYWKPYLDVSSTIQKSSFLYTSLGSRENVGKVMVAFSPFSSSCRPYKASPPWMIGKDGDIENPAVKISLITEYNSTRNSNVKPTPKHYHPLPCM